MLIKLDEKNFSVYHTLWRGEKCLIHDAGARFVCNS